jgi:hypothetical protein
MHQKCTKSHILFKKIPRGDTLGCPLQGEKGLDGDRGQEGGEDGKQEGKGQWG